MDDFRLHVIEKIIDEVGSDGIDEGILEVPPDPKLGDYAFPCFVLSKKLKRAPNQIAEFLKDKIKTDDIISEVKNIGPYLNFFVNKEKVAEKTLRDVRDKKETYGHSDSGKGKTVLVEYPGPNTNKPLHVGHVRNMALGQSMARILETQGFTVKRVNIVNDRGVHICKSMLAYKRWGEGKTPESEDRKSDHFVGDYYVLYNTKAKDDDSLEQEAKAMIKKWEEGDKEIRALWNKMNAWAFSGFAETYKRFDLEPFDKEYYESNTYEGGKKMVLDGVKKGLFVKNEEGAVVVDLEAEGLGEKVLLRSDGTSVYITQDLYTANLRHDDYKFNKMVYVVATEQNYHFKVLFSLLKKLGHPWADGCYHFAYGMVNLPEGKMKSREGTVVDADDLMLEMEELAKDEILKRYKDMEVQAVHDRAKMIGLGAIKFYLLKIDAIKDITFIKEESVSFEGDTGPYLQYTHARARSILRKAESQGIEVSDDVAFGKLVHDSEIALVHALADFPDKVVEASEAFRPHIIAQQLLAIGRGFNEFYHACPCLQEEDKELAVARLLLVDCTRQVIDNGLLMLGINAPEEM
ncbi:arginine--tRNA ligase [Nanoarchaeota archaeon]